MAYSLKDKLLESYNSLKNSGTVSKISNSLLNALPGVYAAKQINQWRNPVVSPVPTQSPQYNFPERSLISFGKTLTTPMYQAGQAMGNVINTKLDSLRLKNRINFLDQQAKLNQARGINPQPIYNQMRQESQQFLDKNKNVTKGYWGKQAAAMSTIGQAYAGAGRPLGLAIGGALGGGIAKITGNDVAQGVGRGMAEGLKTAGVTRFTQPLINSVLPGKLPLQMIVAGIGNVGEDELIARINQQVPGMSDRLTSFAIGAVFQAVPWTRNKPMTKEQLVDEYSKMVSPQEREFIKKNKGQIRDLMGRYAKKAKDWGDNNRVMVNGESMTWNEFIKKHNDQGGYIDLKAKVGKDVAEGRLSDVSGDTTLYHATPNKFDKFDLNRMEGGVAWFTDNPAEIKGNKVGAVQGAGQKLNVMTRTASKDLKWATPEMQDKYYTDQLIQMGYDGVKMPSPEGEGNWYKVFDPNGKLKTGNVAQPSIGDVKPIESIQHPNAPLNLGDVKEVNDFLKTKGVIVEGSGTKTAKIKIPKDIIDGLGLNKNGMTLKGKYYEIERPGALFNIHSDKTTLAQAIQKAEGNIPQPSVPKTPKGMSEGAIDLTAKIEAPWKKQKVPVEGPDVSSKPIIPQSPPNAPKMAETVDSVIEQGRKQIGSVDRTDKRSVGQAAKDFYTQWVDRYNPLIGASKKAKDVLRTKQAELRPEYDPEYLVRRLTGAGGIADTTYQKELKPIIDAADEMNIPKIDLDTYLASKRIAGFGKVGRDIYGADPKQAQKIVSAMETKYHGIQDIAEKFYQYQDKGFQELVDAGFITPEVAQKIRGQNPDYAPLQRVMDDVSDYLGLPTRKTMQGSQPIQKIKGSTRQIESPVESIIANTFSQRAAIEKNRVAQSIVGLQNITDMGYKKVGKSGTDTITVWNGGKKEYWQVGKDIADVAKATNEESMNLVLKIIQAPAALLRQGATGRNPEFMIPNIIRDQLDAGISSKYGYIPFVDYVSGLKSMLTNDEVYQKWQSSGAKIDLGEMSGRKSIKQSFDSKTAKKGIFNWISGALDVMGKYSEQPTRVGLFKKAYQKTGNELLSAMESRDATVDFARMGSKMKVANSIIPFLNVGVQGFDKLVRAVKGNPGKVLLNAGIYGASPAVALTLYNLQNHAKEYQEIPQYEKDNNFVIVKGRNDKGNVDYITIPKGNILPVVTNPIQSFLEFVYGSDKQSFGQMAINVLSNTLPVIQQGDTLKEVGIKTIGSNIPQAIKPLTENLLNKSFYKYDPKKEQTKDIVPQYLQSRPSYKQTYEFTPQMYQKIGAVLNVSPLKVQNLMEGYLAGYSKIPAQIIDAATKISRGESVDTNDKTIVRRFFKETYPNANKTPAYTPQAPGIMERVFGKAKAAETTKTTMSPEEEKWRISDEKYNMNSTGKDFSIVNGKALYKKQNGDIGTYDLNDKKDREALAKQRVLVTKKDVTVEGKYYYYDPESDSVKNVETQFTQKPPEMTGIKEIDKNRVSAYKSSITARIKDLGILLDKEALTEEEVRRELEQLMKLKNTVSGSTGKGKKAKKFISDAELLSAYNKLLKALSAPSRSKTQQRQAITKPVTLKRQRVRPLR